MWHEEPTPFSRQTPETVTDGGTENANLGIPRLNLRNTEKLNATAYDFSSLYFSDF